MRHYGIGAVRALSCALLLSLFSTGPRAAVPADEQAQAVLARVYLDLDQPDKAAASLAEVAQAYGGPTPQSPASGLLSLAFRVRPRASRRAK